MSDFVDPSADLSSDDTDFDELDLLVNPKPTPEAKALDDFDDLEALLGEAMEARAATEQVKAARAKAKSGFANTPEDLERIRRWELANEWKPVANVALFHRYVCACSKHSTVFEGMMLEQVGRSNPRNRRWTAIEDGQLMSGDLPKRTAIRRSEVPMCPVCLPEQGFNLADGLEWTA